MFRSTESLLPLPMIASTKKKVDAPKSGHVTHVDDKHVWQNGKVDNHESVA